MMHHVFRQRPTVLGPVLAVGLSMITGAAQEPIRAPLSDTMPELLEQSAWAQDTTWEGEVPGRAARGVYPVGNGRAFCYMGLGRRACTMLALTGPTYQTAREHAPSGHFGKLKFDLLVAGRIAPLPRQHVRRVRGAGFVVTEDAAPGGLALRTLTFVPPEGARIVRVLEVSNQGERAVGDLVIRLTTDGRVRRTGSALQESYDAGARHYVATYALEGGRAGAEGVLETAPFALEPGASRRTVLEVRTTRAGEPLETSPPTLAGARAAAAHTLRWWKSKLEKTAYFDTDHAKMRDLFEDWKVLMLVQRAESGAVAAMVNRRFFSVRDVHGPLLAFLRFNMWDEARDLLRYELHATRLLGRVPERTPLDLDFSGLEGRRTDWRKVRVPPSELPSWIILHHFWYWRATQDTALIREHWPLLEICLKRQKRAEDTLMTFHGGESYMGGGLHRLWPDRVPADCGFVAHAAEMGRHAYSFASGVLFLIAMQGMGELVDGIDRDRHPERWKHGKPEASPGQAYVNRTFSIMEDIEKRYWLEDSHMFAPALSPVTEEPHDRPLANANLMPLWVGWTFPTGEKSRENLVSTLARLWRRGVRIGSTPTVGHATGHLQGMLLTALVERDARERYAVFEKLLAQAEPDGGWAFLYDPQDRPVGVDDPAVPDRLCPGVSGVNLDALLYAINGARFAAVPNWDNTDIRLKLRLPPGATYVSMKDLAKDGRRLNIFFRETRERLSKAELEQNEKLAPKNRRDPTKPYRRVRFRVELVSENPERGYYDVGLNAAGTMFVRYLWREQPIEEMEFWAEETERAFPLETGPLPARGERPPKVPTEGATTLCLAMRDLAAELYGGDDVTMVDTGLPLRIETLTGLLLDEKRQPRHQHLLLDWGCTDPGPSTFKRREFWNSPAWRDALAAFVAAGGKVVEPGYARAFLVESEDGLQQRAAPGGRLELPAGAPARVRMEVISDLRREAVLRVGSGCSVSADLDGKSIYRREGPRTPLPDTDAELVTLAPGKHVLEFRLTGEGERVLFVRITDSRGRPVKGIRYGP